jgi:hypothetical protein
MIGNWFKTTLLMAAIVAIFGGVGLLLGGPAGMLLALLVGGAMNLWAYWFSSLEAAESHPATAQMMTMNPLSGGGLAGLFSTHPDAGERIARLQAMARGLARA